MTKTTQPAMMKTTRAARVKAAQTARAKAAAGIKLLHHFMSYWPSQAGLWRQTPLIWAGSESM